MKLSEKTKMLITINQRYRNIIQEIQNALDKNITETTIKINGAKYTNATNFRMYIRHVFKNVQNELVRIEKELQNGKQ